MQSIRRSRWLIVTVGWVLLAAAAWGGAVAGLITWWSSPVNALQQQNFQPAQFDIQGIVPIGYAVFAVALGIAAGALFRRALPAMAVTLVVFTLVRLLISEDFRWHYLTPVTKTLSFTHPVMPRGSYWLVSSGLIGGGRTASSSAGPHLSIDGIAINPASLPSACRNLIFQHSPSFFSCLTAHGYRGYISYQPADRYWAFQGIETGIFVLLAAVVLAVAAIVVLRRDA
jgi:hypothetical protein